MNKISGTKNADKIQGTKENDWIFGDDGNDFIFGGKGDDVIYGGSGSDVLNGGKGADRFILNPADGIDIVDGHTKGDVYDFRSLGFSNSAEFLWTHDERNDIWYARSGRIVYNSDQVNNPGSSFVLDKTYAGFHGFKPDDSDIWF